MNVNDNIELSEAAQVLLAKLVNAMGPQFTTEDPEGTPMGELSDKGMITILPTEKIEVTERGAALIAETEGE